MCFEFGSCFGNGRREDYGGERAPRGAREGRGRRAAGHRNGYYSGTDQETRAPAYHQQQHDTAMDETGRKAYHDGERKDHHATTDARGHGGYDTPKLLEPWHNKVGDDAGYKYTAHLHGTAADRRETGAVDHYHYPTSTTNTSLVSNPSIR